MRKPVKNYPESQAGATLDAAEFGLSSDTWLEQARQADRSESLGRWLDYEILSPATRGGQAMVYRCRRADGAVVAVKRIHGGAGATPGAKRRLQRELDVTAALTHPRIPSPRTVNVGNELLIETDWIDGRPLVDWCRDAGVEGLPDVPGILRVMICVCDAVQFAHERGVIHRDLKPSNILVDGDGQPHVLDFGLAGTLAELSSDATRVTLSEPLVGTPAYASPEQIAGDPSRIDARTDVYSLGVLLYEAFTGVSPYPPKLSLGRSCTPSSMCSRRFLACRTQRSRGTSKPSSSRRCARIRPNGMRP
jgi:serine/threonine protein kinase